MDRSAKIKGSLPGKIRYLANISALIACVAVLLAFYAVAHVGARETDRIRSLSSARLAQDNFITYSTHEYLSFFSKGVADSTILKENIKRVGDGFISQAGMITTEPFQAPEYMIVPVLGGDPDSVHTLEMPEIFLQCVADGRRMALLRAPTEGWIMATARVPKNWCAGKSRIVGISHQDRIHVGIGSPFEVSRLYWLLLQPLGAVVAGILALALVAIMILPLMAAGGLPVLVRIVAAVAYPSVLGYFCYCFFWQVTSPEMRTMAASAFMAAPLAVLLIDAVLRRNAVDGRMVRLFLAGLAAVAALTVLPYCLMPLGNGFWFPAYAYFPASWSTDNLLSVMMARNLLLLGPGHPEFLGTWSISDRGVIQAGVFAAAFALPGLGSVFLSSPFSNIISNLYGCLIQGLPLPLALTFFTFLGWPKRRAALAALVIAASPFFIFNTFYIWPKLYGGAFVAIAILALWSALRRGCALALCAAIVAFVFGCMNHTSNLLAAPAIGLYLVAALAIGHHTRDEVLTLARRGLAPAAIVVVVMALAFESQGLFEPKGSWPILFLITGEGQFGLSPAQVHERIFDYLRHVDLWQVLRERAERLGQLAWVRDAFYTRGQIWPSLRFTRAVEQFSLLPSLGPGIFLLMATALAPWRRLRTNGATTYASTPQSGGNVGKGPALAWSGAEASGDLSRTMTLLWLSCGLNLVLLASVQGPQPVVHQLPYGLVEGVILGLVSCRHSWTAALPIAAALQAVNAALVWFGGSWAFWHERL